MVECCLSELDRKLVKYFPPVCVYAVKMLGQRNDKCSLYRDYSKW